MRFAAGEDSGSNSVTQHRQPEHRVRNRLAEDRAKIPQDIIRSIGKVLDGLGLTPTAMCFCTRLSPAGPAPWRF